MNTRPIDSKYSLGSSASDYVKNTFTFCPENLQFGPSVGLPMSTLTYSPTLPLASPLTLHQADSLFLPSNLSMNLGSKPLELGVKAATSSPLPAPANFQPHMRENSPLLSQDLPMNVGNNPATLFANSTTGREILRKREVLAHIFHELEHGVVHAIGEGAAHTIDHTLEHSASNFAGTVTPLVRHGFFLVDLIGRTNRTETPACALLGAGVAVTVQLGGEALVTGLSSGATLPNMAVHTGLAVTGTAAGNLAQMACEKIIELSR